VSVIVFLGPTLPRRDAEGLLDADYRPPAAFGDVFRAARERPSVIGIVDGYFEGRPAVWHKEILWALSEGTHVFGAASIGALRAAELVSFGMVGVGRIFEDYAKGTLEDDDNVAVSHGPAETGYLKINEPMVNVRATLLQAAAQGIVDEQERLRIEQAAKSIYYKERTYQAVLREAERADVAEQTLRRLETWLPAGQVYQKRLDAMDLLRAIAAHAASDPEPKQVGFRLSQSAFWQNAQDEALKGETAEDDRHAGPGGAVDELRLDPGMYRLAQLPRWGESWRCAKRVDRICRPTSMARPRSWRPCDAAKDWQAATTSCNGCRTTESATRNSADLSKKRRKSQCCKGFTGAARTAKSKPSSSRPGIFPGLRGGQRTRRTSWLG